MPLQVIGNVSYKNYTPAQAFQFAVMELGTSAKDLFALIAEIGITAYASAALKGIAKTAFQTAADPVMTELEIFKAIEAAGLTSSLKTVADTMVKKEQAGLNPGYMIIKWADCQWVSSNGNQYSGVFYGPASIFWSATKY
ncbi:hypothetical protein [Geosporobacter ferrireducens]|uniref:Uncharacterized protein n=1 Tax=Geosporobacter ferrireducens TaxID=1424294 RepID=A0A1D8GNU2_9FIRM|nr:hypothetical protein [Geosporobacter ferrireducens]AOT72537.1 hypothetical protein Gferi_25075 [Geosporobacter ferrireducens]